MYNLLIVDDETAIVNGLAYDIDWNELGVLEVFKANEVRSALEILKVNKIDVIITDIRMPGMDGIEFATVIRRQWPYARIIFISGYDEFEYAQKAIDMGIFSYVMKPMRNEKIKGIVARALQSIEEDLDRTKVMLDAKRQTEELLPLLRQRYLNNWIVQDRVEADSIKLNELAIGMEEMAFLIMVTVDQRETSPGGRDPGSDDVLLANMIGSILLNGSNPAIHFLDADENIIYVVHGTNADNLSDAQQYVKGMAEPFLLTVQRTLGCTVSLFWSDSTLIRNLPSEYKKTREHSRLRLQWKPGVIMGPEQGDIQRDSLRLDMLHEYPQFPTIVEKRDRENAIQRVNAIFAEAEEKGTLSYHVLIQIFYAIVGALLNDSARTEIPIDVWCGANQQFLLNPMKITKLGSLKSYCMEMTIAYFDHLMTIERKQVSKLVEQVEQFVDENLGNEISVMDIATHLHLHPNYLFRLFKEETGLSVIEYLIEKRIGKARVLLADKNAKIYEVAGNVGYESVSHFSRIFKRETGMSPKEYQQNLH